MIVINTVVIFLFGLVVAGVVAIGVVQSRELAKRQATIDMAERNNPSLRAGR